MKPVKSLGLLAVILAVSGVSFGIFLDGSSGDLHSIFNIASNGVEIMGGLFIVLALMFVYQALR